jgi:hypothetical protein
MDIDKWGDGPSPIILRDMQAPLERGDSLTRCQLGEPRSPRDLEHGCSYIYRINSINSLYASKGLLCGGLEAYWVATVSLNAYCAQTLKYCSPPRWSTKIFWSTSVGADCPLCANTKILRPVSLNAHNAQTLKYCDRVAKCPLCANTKILRPCR